MIKTLKSPARYLDMTISNPNVIFTPTASWWGYERTPTIIETKVVSVLPPSLGDWQKSPSVVV